MKLQEDNEKLNRKEKNPDKTNKKKSNNLDETTRNPTSS